MKNWKTSLFGILASIGMFIGGGNLPGIDLNGVMGKVATILQVAGTTGLALSSKDKDVTGAGPGATRIPSGN